MGGVRIKRGDQVVVTRGANKNQKGRVLVGFRERGSSFVTDVDKCHVLHPRVGELLPAVERAYKAAMADLSTTALTRELEAAVMEHPPPMVRGRRIRLRYAHQGGKNPPIIVVHGNQTERLPQAYRRYLVNAFRKRFDLAGTPVRIEFKSSQNPYAGRRNTLTPRQQRKRARMLKQGRKSK